MISHKWPTRCQWRVLRSSYYLVESRRPHGPWYVLLHVTICSLETRGGEPVDVSPGGGERVPYSSKSVRIRLKPYMSLLRQRYSYPLLSTGDRLGCLLLLFLEDLIGTWVKNSTQIRGIRREDVCGHESDFSVGGNGKSERKGKRK